MGTWNKVPSSRHLDQGSSKIQLFKTKSVCTRNNILKGTEFHA